MENLNNNELLAARSIINIGLCKAAESLSFFMKEEISFNSLCFSVKRIEDGLDFTTKRGTNIHLLITYVIGELKGVCCLVFSEEEANKLRHTALPKEVTENPVAMAEMSDAILLEVDNIISASVITQFSNILKHNIYGGVPELKKFSCGGSLDAFVKSTFLQDMYVINFKIQFTSKLLNFSPEFVWLFDSTFLDSIRTFVSDQANLLKLEELSSVCENYNGSL
jgi:chemotaxis protein CheY-P-specific phosphatase CheC